MKIRNKQIVIGSLLGILLLSGCTSNESATTQVKETPTVEEVTPKEGSIENPLPIGSAIETTSDHVPISLSFLGLDQDGNSKVPLPGFVPEADPGFHWVVLKVQITNTSSDSTEYVSAGDIGAVIHLADSSGQVFDGSFAMLVEGLDVIDDPYPGETVTGEMAYQVPDGATSLMASYKGIFVVVL